MKNVQRLVLLVIVSLASLTMTSNVKAQICESAYCSQFLVKFSRRAAEQDIDAILVENDLGVLYYSEASRIYRLIGDPNRAPEGILEALNAEELVIYAEPNYEIQASSAPNDPRYPELWALNNTGQYDGGIAGLDIGMESVWNSLGSYEPVLVAVLDSGIDYAHEDLAANMWHNPGEVRANGIDDDHNGYVDDYYGYDFAGNDGDPYDDYFHGTHVAGTIGAVGDNGIGMTGIDMNAQIMALKFMGSTGIGSLGDAIEAIDYAIDNGAKIINNSWDFYYAGTYGLPTNPSLEPVQSLRDVIAAADAAGVIFVAAAGNDGLNADSYPTYPAAYSVSNIISVAATDVDDTLPAFSNYGKISVDIGAPGVLIESTYPTWKETPPYHYLSGTSMATPHVTGAAALLWAANPQLTHRQVISDILQGALPISDLQGKSVTGGRLDLAESFVLSGTGVNHAPVANAGAAQYRNVGDSVLLQGTATDGDGDTPLSYTWTLVSPALETNTSYGAQLSFTADLVGTYTATLTVSDGAAVSAPSTALVTVSGQTSSNRAPTSSAGPNQLRHIGDSVLLQGKGTDVDGDTLTYKWTLAVPTGSNSVLASATSATASFSADTIGTYSATLTVSDGKATAVSTAKVYVVAATTENHAPTASAGPNQLRRVGDNVLLQGKGTDADGDALTYRWTLALPAGSKSVLASATSATASFYPDIIGTYSATLTVSDGKTSVTATAKVYVNQALSLAIATQYNVRYEVTASEEIPSQTVLIGAQKEGDLAELDPELGGQVGTSDVVLLDGSDSVISSLAPTDYEWILVEKPVGSDAFIENADQSLARFTPDIEGQYTVQLVLNSGKITLYGERAFLALETPVTTNESEDAGSSTGDDPAETGSAALPMAAPGGCSLITD